MRNKGVAVAVGVAVGVLVFVWMARRRSAPRPEKFEAPVAVGLRDQVTVNRPLSATQSSKLWQHFLETPVSMTPTRPAPMGSSLAVVDQVNRINRLNRQQAER